MSRIFRIFVLMNKLIISAVKEEGKLKIINKTTMDRWIDQLPDGEKVELSFIKDKDLKTLQQLRLVYKCFRTLSNHLGYDVEEIKLMMKIRTGYCFERNVDGSTITVCKSLGEFSKKDLNTFIEYMDNWSSMTLNYPLLNFDEKQFIKD